MMEGITILSEYTAGGAPPFATVVGMMAAVVGLVFIIAGILEEADLIMAIGLVAVCAVGGIAIAVEFVAEDPHQRYEVLIDDTVPFVEFYDRYEIIDQNGLIYEVRERNET